MGGRDGLFTFERDVLDQWDAGSGSRAIAAALGKSEERVMHVLSTYVGGDGGSQQERHRHAALRDACAGHAAAIAATGRGYA